MAIVGYDVHTCIWYIMVCMYMYMVHHGVYMYIMACIFMYVCVSMVMCIHVYGTSWRVYICTSRRVYICTSWRVCICIYVYVYIHIHIYMVHHGVYIYVSVCVPMVSQNRKHTLCIQYWWNVQECLC